jgi:hypothetical protein
VRSDCVANIAAAFVIIGQDDNIDAAQKRRMFGGRWYKRRTTPSITRGPSIHLPAQGVLKEVFFVFVALKFLVYPHGAVFHGAGFVIIVVDHCSRIIRRRIVAAIERAEARRNFRASMVRN